MRSDHVTVTVDVDRAGATTPDQLRESLPVTGLGPTLLALALVLLALGILLVALSRYRSKEIKMKKMFKILAAALTLGLVASLTSPAFAGEVTVGLSNPGGSRTLYVEDLAGSPLTAIDFGTSRAAPFRVRVVDQTMDRAGFSVSATMSNLYVDNNGTIDYSKKIDAANLSVSNPADPLNVLNLSASVQPLVDTTATITDLTICQVLGLVTSLINGTQACQATATGLVGHLQSAVPVQVNLADLSNLPLLPQAAEPGAFTNADYQGIGLNDPNKPASFTPTARRMLAGSPISTSVVLDALKAALDVNPRSDLISDPTITNGLAAVLANWELLTPEQVQTVLNGTIATVQNLVPEQVRAQTGTYFSFPVLNVNVPSTAAKGNYKGTLVVTALQP